MKIQLASSLMGRLRQPGRARRFYPYGIALLMGLLVTAGCAQGSYPLDIFYEMHYQPSYKANEPPRLSAPASAVPFYPAPQATSFVGDGRHLFEVNCSMCHGLEGKGDGPVLQRMMDVYGYVPALDPNLTSPAVMPMGPEGIQGFMFSGVVVMPNFTKLLSREEMRLIAEYVVFCLQGSQPQSCPP